MRAAFGVILMLAGSGAAADPALSPGEIRAEILGAPIAWRETEGWRYGWLYLAPDGGARIDLMGPEGSIADEGRWRLEGDRLCTTWSALREGVERCYGLRRAGAARFVTTGGNVFEVLAPGA
jgi:hypothetical protein